MNTFYYHYWKPIFIVEKGLGALDKLEGDTVHDQYRIDFLAAHIKQMKIAIEEDGVDVIDNTPWSAIDMVSFSTGETKKRYGFIYVDNDSEYGDNKRYKKQSFDWYKKVY